jgi:hypothetical integral membrane protein (TIGR02206 family)
MGQFFAGPTSYQGEPFVLFSRTHIIALLIIAGVNVALILLLHRFTARSRRLFRYGLAGLLLVDEALWHAWNGSTGQWTVQKMLPFHLCSVLVFVSATLLLTKSYRLYEFVYFLGLGGATQALMTPDAGQFGFPHFRFFQVFVSHGAIFTTAMYMTLVEQYRPHRQSLIRVLGGLHVYALAVMGVNALLGSNYLFIARKPETASLIDVLGPWPWYILVLDGIAIGTCLLLYIPFAIRDRRANAVNPATNPILRT